MLKLSFDAVKGTLVSWQGGKTALGTFTQGTIAVQLRFVTPNPDSAPNSDDYYLPLDLDDYAGPRIGLFADGDFSGDNSAANALAVTPQDEFTLNSDDADDPYYVGTFNLQTAEIAALGTIKTKACYFTCGLVKTEDGSIEAMIKHRGTSNCTLEAAMDSGFGSLPVSLVPDRRRIKLPCYFYKDGVDVELLVDFNADNTGINITVA